jgi:translation initiation factor IF-3
MVLKDRDKKAESTQFLNENIPFSQILLVIGKEGKEIVSRQEALKRAKKLGLDLFCVAPTKSPPVCKLIDYQKHLFELSKKKKDKKTSICKEIDISFNIGENDLKVKLGKIQKLIEKGAMVKVKLVVGRKKIHPDLTREKCQKIITELQSQSPKIELKDDIRQHFGSLYFFLYKKRQ